MKTKILILHPYNRYIGGAEHSLIQLLANLDRQRFEVQAFLPAGGALTKDAEAYVDKLHLYQRHPTFHSNRLGQIVSTARQIASIVRAESIDLLHANTFFISNHSLLAARLSKIPLILHWRDNHYKKEFRTGLRLSKKRPFTIVTVSDYIKELFRDEPFYPDKIRTIHNGIDIEKYRFNPETRRDFRCQYGLDENTFALGILSRLEADKGHPLLLEALARLIRETEKKNRPELRLFVFHQGPEKSRLEELVRELDLEDSVCFAGHVENVSGILSGLDAIINTAAGEAFGRLALEANAASLPLVASNSGGFRETVIDGQTGLLFPPGDAGGLASTIRRLIVDSKLREALRRDGLAHVCEHFSASKNAEKIMRLYDETSAQSNRSRK